MHLFDLLITLALGSLIILVSINILKLAQSLLFVIEPEPSDPDEKTIDTLSELRKRLEEITPEYRIEEGDWTITVYAAKKFHPQIKELAADFPEAIWLRVKNEVC